jgi:hypothetical protein
MLFASPDPGRARIGFFDSRHESAVDLERRVSRAPSAIAERSMLVAEFHSVDIAHSPDVAKIADELRVHVLKLDVEADAATDTQTFVLQFLQTR